MAAACRDGEVVIRTEIHDARALLDRIEQLSGEGVANSERRTR